MNGGISMRTSEWNNRKEQTIQKKAKSRKQQRTKQIYLRLISTACLICAIATICSTNFFQINAEASSEQGVVSYKYYTSVTVQTGETLWDIANIYMSDEFSSVQKYIDEVKSINHLTDDRIYAGEELIVPHYSWEYKR
jgi:LysM repeat protein